MEKPFKTIRPFAILTVFFSSISFLTLAILTSNSALAAVASAAYVSANYSGFVNSISDPTGTLSGAIEIGDVVTSDFLITTYLDDLVGPSAGGGTIGYYYPTSTRDASLTVGTTDFNNIDLRLREVWSGYFAGDVYSQLVMDGSASASGLGAVGLNLQVRDANNIWPAEWPSAEDFHIKLSEIPHIGCDPIGCLETNPNGSWGTSLLLTGEQYGIEIFLTDFELNVSPVPIPGAAWLFGSCLLGLIGISRRRSSK